VSAARPQDAHVPEVIWHDVECGAYAEDLPLWRDLAISHAGPVLDVGAGTGRVSLHLAGQGHRVVALDRSPDLLAALRARSAGLQVETVAADARDFDLGERRFEGFGVGAARERQRFPSGLRQLEGVPRRVEVLRVAHVEQTLESRREGAEAVGCIHTPNVESV